MKKKNREINVDFVSYNQIFDKKFYETECNVTVGKEVYNSFKRLKIEIINKMTIK